MARTFVNGKVFVRRRQCATCIFRPENKGRIHGISDERRDQMTADADRDGGCIPCHTHLYVREPINPVCRGYFDINNSIPLRLADAMGYIEWYDHD
jgi:hypothetical protein